MSVINWHKDRQETPPDEVYWPSQELPQEHAPPVLNRRKSTTITTSNLAEWQRPAANFKATFPPSKGPPALLIYPTDTLYDITRTLARFLEPNFIGLSIASTGERLTPALWGIVCEEALRRHAPAIALGFLYRSFTVRFRYPYSAPLVVRARETLAGLEARMVVGDPGRLESVVRLRGDGGSERPKWWCRETMGSWGDRLTERTWALMRDEALKNGTEDLRLAFVDGDV